MTVETGPTIHRLSTSAAERLAQLAAVLDDLQTVLRCCEVLLPTGAPRPQEMDPTEREAVWTTALLSYGRCFATGGHSGGLTEEDLGKTDLEGELVEWHRMLLRLRRHFADQERNPRGQFAVGIATEEDGTVSAITITSTDAVAVDDQTVHQTGALALELGKLVDQRIEEQQKHLMADVEKMSSSAVEKLPLIDVAVAPEAAQ